MFAEVIFRARLKPIHALPQINLVGVQRKNLLLGKIPLNLDRQQNFLQLAMKRSLRREKQILRQLHGQRGSALGAPIRRQIPIRCPGHAKQIDAPVAFKVLIFNRDDGVAKHWRNIVVADNNSPLQRERSNLVAVNVVELASWYSAGSAPDPESAEGPPYRSAAIRSAPRTWPPESRGSRTQRNRPIFFFAWRVDEIRPGERRAVGRRLGCWRCEGQGQS